MVFESIVADLLNRFLGDYVENLDRSQLKLGIWGGDVVLENLELKDNAFGGLDLPLTTVKGRLGKLILKIPWKNIYTSPVVASLEGIYLLVIPKSDSQYDAEKEKKAALETKMKQLQNIEEAKIKAAEKKTADPNQDSFTEKMVAQIMKNLQVRISDIHIRYEDCFSNSSQPFAFGLTLHNLAFETTDEDWKIGSAQTASKFIFKAIKLDSLSIYLDSHKEGLLSRLDSSAIYAGLKSGISTPECEPKLSFILNPICSSAKLRLNPKPEADGSNYTIPKVFFVIDLHQITLSLSKSQFQCITKLLESVERMNLSSSWRQFRPNQRVLENRTVWWKFAYTCIVEDGVRRRKRNWSWTHMKQHRNNFRNYKELYLQKLKSGKISVDVRKKLDALEETLDVFNITLARKLADMEFARLELSNPGKESYTSWISRGISSWVSWKKEKKSEDDVSIVQRFEEAMTGDEKSKLYAAIDYQENAVPTVYPKSFIENDVRVSLTKLAICVIDDSLRQPEVLHLSLDGVQTNFEMRPSASAIKLTSLIKSLNVYGYADEKSSCRPVLAQSVTSSLDDKAANLLDFLFETNPEDGSCDQRIHLHAQPLEIAFNAESIARLTEVYKSPEPVELSRLQEEARSTMLQFRESSATGLQHAIAMQKILDLKIDVKSSYVIIPENGVYNKTSSVIVAHFGSLKMQSIPRKYSASNLQSLTRSGSTESEKLKEMMEQSYDQFTFELTGVQIVLAGADDNWKEAQDVNTPLHILRPTNLYFNLSKCIIQDDHRLPSLKIKGNLPEFCLHISDKKILQLAVIAFSISKTSQESDDLMEKPKAMSLHAPKSSADVAAKSLLKANLAVSKPTAEEAFVQMTRLELTFEIGNMKLILNELEEQLFTVCISQVGLIVKQKDYEMEVEAFIDDLCMEEKQFKVGNGESLKMIYIPRSEGSRDRMLSINYVNANRKSPGFATVHHSVEQSIRLKFTKLGVVLHKEALLKVISFSNAIQSKLDSLKPANEVDKLDILKRSTSTIASVYEYAKDAVGPRMLRKRVRKPNDEIINLKTEIYLDCFNVHICNQLKSISNISINGLKVYFTMKKSCNQIQAQLTNLSIIDSNPDAFYKQILSFVEGDAFNVEVITYNVLKKKAVADVTAVDTSLSVSIGSLTFVFLNKYIAELLCFVNCFQAAKEKVAEASAAAAKAAGENMKEAYENATKVKLAFYLKSPVIIMPKHSTSLNAVVANLGSIKVSNEFRKISEQHTQTTPVIDKILISLDNLQLSRAAIDKDTFRPEWEHLLLQPVSFRIDIQRNLCISWYKELPELVINGNLGVIQLILSDLDYSVVMQVLEENFAEGKVEDVPPEMDTDRQISRDPVVDEFRYADAGHEEKEDVAPFKRLTFNFNMDSFLFMLRTSPQTVAFEETKTQPLATFELLKITAKGEMWSDNKMKATVGLANCIWDDTRTSRNKNGITRLMQQLDGGAVGQQMIQLNFSQQSNGNKEVDLSVHSFSLVFCVEYSMLLAAFFQTQDNSSKKSKSSEKPLKHSSKTEMKDVSKDAISTSSTKIRFKIYKPDIVVVEDVDNIDTPSLIFQNEIDLRLTMTGSNLNLMLSIAQLQLFSSSFNIKNRTENLVEILSPCEISVVLNKSADSTKIDINSTPLMLHIAPLTVQLLTSISSSFGSSAATKEVLVENEPPDYSDLWIAKRFDDENFWFLKPEVGRDAVEMLENDKKVASLNEQLIVELKSIVLTVEAQVGSKTVPMIILESSFLGDVRNWSGGQMSANCSVNMEAAYFNQRLEVWEPLIESVDDGKGRRAWELVLELKKQEDEMPGEVDEEDIEEVQFQPPKTMLKIFSASSLELAVTKSALKVISNLGKVFGEAVTSTKKATKKIHSLAPYELKNETGISVSLLINDTDFDVADRVLPEAISDVQLDPGAVVQLRLKKNSKTADRKSILQEQDTLIEHSLMLKVMDVARQMRVTRAEKRYFPLPYRTYPGDQWGLVAEVKAEDSCKTITLRSVIQVVNHLCEAVEIYYMTEGGNELQFCGEVEAFCTLNLPFRSVYTPTNEIFLRPSGNRYSVSIIPLIWKDLLKVPTMKRLLKCEPKESGQPAFYINAVGEMEKIFYENTKKKTLPSTCYEIRLYPAVVLTNLLPKAVTYTLQGPYEEVTVERGQSKQLLNVDTTHSALTIKIPDYMDQEWKCTKTFTNQIDAVWTFTSQSPQNLTLDLGCRVQDEEGFLHLTLYCPFWMINKTSMPLSYRRSKKGEKHLSRGSPVKSEDSSTVIPHPGNMADTPILFSFKPKVFFTKKMASIRIGDSDWSDKFTLDTVGTSGLVSCPNKSGVATEVGVEIRLSSTGLTKIVVFTPFYLIVNNAPYDVHCREAASLDDWSLIPTEQCVALWPKSSRKELVVRVAGSREETKPFKYSEAQSTLLALPNSKGGVHVDCHLTESSCLITLDPYTCGMSNCLLVNHCSNYPIYFKQSGMDKMQSLGPSYMLFYTWEDPNGIKEFIWSVNEKDKYKNTLIMDGIGESVVQDDESVYWVSFLDANQRVLLFTDDLAIATNAQCTNELERNDLELMITLPGIGLSLIDDILRREVAYLAVTSPGVVWETAKFKSNRWTAMKVKDCHTLETAFNKFNAELKLNKNPKSRQNLEGKLDVDFTKGMLYRPLERNIRRTYQSGLWLQLMSSPHKLQFHIKINRLQIDNQLFECVFPTVLAPVPLPKTVVADVIPKSFIEACIVLRKNERSKIKQFKYFKVLVQEFDIKLDQGFINALIALFQQSSAEDSDKIDLMKADLKVAAMDLKALAAIANTQEVKNFYDVLHFSPLKISISFSMQGGGENDPKKPTAIHSEFLNLLLQSFGVTLTEIQDVVFKLGFFEKQHVFMSEKQLLNEVKKHYAAQAMKQMYVLILGLDVIGNPFGLVMGLGKGLEDFFYEPFQGAVQGPEEFAEGLAFGIRSLLGHTVGGAAGVFSRITGTLGKGVAALTMDDEYQKKRREALNKRPANLQQGLAQSGKGLVMGVYDGVTGVFVKPIEGAKQEGVGGFFKGVGKGMVGLVARPASGVMDFASGSFDAVKRAADLSEEIAKLRPPRYLQTDGRVRAYNRIEAEGNNLLLELDKGKFAATDNYIAHAVVTDDGRVVLLVTDKRVIMISKGDIFGQWNCEWNFTWDELVGPPKMTNKGYLHFEIKAHKKGKKVLGLFGRDMSSKVVEIKNPELTRWMMEKISLAIKSDN